MIGHRELSWIKCSPHFHKADLHLARNKEISKMNSRLMSEKMSRVKQKQSRTTKAWSEKAQRVGKEGSVQVEATKAGIKRMGIPIKERAGALGWGRN